MKLTEISLKRPVTVCMFFVCLTLIGIMGGRQLPLEFLPDIEFPGLFVQIPYRNSTPEEVERRITRPVEEALATLSGIEQMESTSRDDGAEIEIRFKIGEDMAIKGVEARDKLDAIRASLPADVERMNVFKFTAGDIPMLQFRISADRDLKNSYDMLERNLKRRIERIEGVSRVELYGVEKKEIRIELAAEPQRCCAFGEHVVDEVDDEAVRRRLQRDVALHQIDFGAHQQAASDRLHDVGARRRLLSIVRPADPEAIEVHRSQPHLLAGELDLRTRLARRSRDRRGPGDRSVEGLLSPGELGQHRQRHAQQAHGGMDARAVDRCSLEDVSHACAEGPVDHQQRMLGRAHQTLHVHPALRRFDADIGEQRMLDLGQHHLFDHGARRDTIEPRRSARLHHEAPARQRIFEPGELRQLSRVDRIDLQHGLVERAVIDRRP